VQVVSVAVGMAVLDQVSKAIIRHQMTLHESIPVFSDVFHITYILNRGAAFGVLENQQWLFLLIAFFLFVLYGMFRTKLPSSRLLHVGMGLLLGGALGNALDRCIHGAVVDFFDFLIWPVFNLADVGIVIGVMILLWYSWHHKISK
jgi:hypothetical protein